MTTNSQYELNKGLAQMLKGGVIMDVTTPEQAKICLLYTSLYRTIPHIIHAVQSCIVSCF